MRREGIPGPVSKTVNANGSGMSEVMETQCLFFQNEINLNLCILTVIFLHILVLLIYIQSPNLLKKNPGDEECGLWFMYIHETNIHRFLNERVCE